MPSRAVQIEALLFAAGKALSINELASYLNVSTKEIEQALLDLEQSLASRGINLIRGGHTAELATAAAVSEVVDQLYTKEASVPLSKASLETLSIIVHRQPIAKHEIEAVRGVASDQIISNLVGRGLIEARGRSEAPISAPLYHTTTLLLRHLGVSSLDELKAQVDAR